MSVGPGPSFNALALSFMACLFTLRLFISSMEIRFLDSQSPDGKTTDESKNSLSAARRRFLSEHWYATLWNACRINTDYILGNKTNLINIKVIIPGQSYNLVLL